MEKVSLDAIYSKVCCIWCTPHLDLIPAETRDKNQNFSKEVDSMRWITVVFQTLLESSVFIVARAGFEPTASAR